MREVCHWKEARQVRSAYSKGGVPVTTHPLDNVVRGPASPWPTPELLQKFHGSARFQGMTPDDDKAAREGLGYYSHLQSLNSEDAMTWSVFGTLGYLPIDERRSVVNKLFSRLDLAPATGGVRTWVWRRLPHPEKPEAMGGPEIDFGILTDHVLLLGEAKWNSGLGTGQGVEGNRTQLDLRVAYCTDLARRALRSRRHDLVVLGVARESTLLDDNPISPEVKVRNLAWCDVIECLPSDLATEVSQYVKWRVKLTEGAA